jgi:hypothetical protein
MQKNREIPWIHECWSVSVVVWRNSVEIRIGQCNCDGQRLVSQCYNSSTDPLRWGHSQGIIDGLKSKNQTLYPSSVKIELLRLVDARVGGAEVCAVDRRAKDTGHVVSPYNYKLNPMDYLAGRQGQEIILCSTISRPYCIKFLLMKRITKCKEWFNSMPRNARFFSSPQRPDRLWGSPSIFPCG